MSEASEALTPCPSPKGRGETTPCPSPGTDRRLVGRGETGGAANSPFTCRAGSHRPCSPRRTQSLGRICPLAAIARSCSGDSGPISRPAISQNQSSIILLYYPLPDRRLESPATIACLPRRPVSRGKFWRCGGYRPENRGAAGSRRFRRSAGWMRPVSDFLQQRRPLLPPLRHTSLAGVRGRSPAAAAPPARRPPGALRRTSGCWLKIASQQTGYIGPAAVSTRWATRPQNQNRSS